MINLTSTGIRRSDSLVNKLKQKYGLFYKFSLALVVVCEVG